MKIFIFLYVLILLFTFANSSVYLDEEMQSLVNEVRGNLDEVATNNADLREWLDKNSNGIIANWIINSERDLRKAEVDLIEHVKWRKSKDIDNAKNWDYSDKENEEMPFAVTGHDEHGDVVVLMPIGIWNIREILRGGTPVSKINRQIIRMWEYGMQTPDPKTGILPDNMIFLVDLHEFSLWHSTSIRAISVVATGGHAYMRRFPMYAKRAILFGDPPYFQIMWSAVKGILPKRARDRVTLHGTDEESWKKAIFEVTPKSAIPNYRGGDAIVNWKTHSNDLIQ